MREANDVSSLLCALFVGVMIHLVPLYWLHQQPLKHHVKVHTGWVENHGEEFSAPFAETEEEWKPQEILEQAFEKLFQEAEGQLPFCELECPAEWTPPQMHLEGLGTSSLAPSPISMAEEEACTLNPNLPNGEILVRNWAELTSEGIQTGLPHAESIPVPPLLLNSGLPQDQFLSIQIDVPTLDSFQNRPCLIEGVKGSEGGNVASSQDFNLSIEYCPSPSGRGYFFRTVILPKPEALLRCITQNYFFLIDRSHSIDPQRYVASKQAVLQVLELLHPSDRFNILVFDAKVQALATQPVSWSPENLKKAKAFLEDQEHGGMFACTELYASLDRIIPTAVADDEINTAILLSDGDTYLSVEAQRKTIQSWTQKNNGRVALFSVAAGSGNNLSLLDLLSRLNKGRVIHCPDFHGLPAQLGALVTAIRNPIGKDLQIAAIPASELTHIQLYPRSHRLPHLYENIPYVVYGEISEPGTFHLFLQGRHFDKWLDLHQQVSFEPGAMRENVNLKKHWTALQAYDCYDRFLADGDASFLEKAKILRARVGS